MKFTKRDKRTNLEKEIDNLLSLMSEEDPQSDRYAALMVNLVEIHKAKAQEKSNRVSPDTIAVVAANLLGIGLIIWHEKANVITTKALGFIMRGRV